MPGDGCQQRRIRRPVALISLLLLSMIAPAAAAVAAETDPCSIPESLTDIRPDADGDPIRVNLGIFLVDLVDIDELRESFTVDFFVRLRWRDPRLSVAALGHALDDCTLELADIWHPDVHPVNQRGIARERERDVDVMPDGTVRLRERILGELSASLNLNDFPFDSQTLQIQLASFEYGPADVVFAIDEAETGRMENAFLGGWNIVSNTSDPTIRPLSGKTRQRTHLEHSIVIERRSAYFVWKVVVPLVLIVLMASSVFWIDPRAIAPQIGVSTASVFSLITLQIGIRHDLPRVDYLTRLDEFGLSVTVLVFLAVGESVLTTSLAMQEHYDTAIRIERISRWAYPSVLVALLVFHLAL